MSRPPLPPRYARAIACFVVGLMAPRGEVRADVDNQEKQAGEAAQRQPVVIPAQEEPSLFRSENDDVARGNQRMADQDPAGALLAYEQAAKSLPNEGGVHLNRGLALLAKGEVEKSRDALQLATQPPAPKPIRSAAYYNLGNSFLKEADGFAAQEQHEQAQARLREAVDAYKQSLRLQPGDANAAWNLALASRRLQEEQQKQEQQDQQQDDQDGQQQDQKQQDQQQQQQDQKQQDQQQQDQEQQDQQQQDQQQDPNKPPEDQEKPEGSGAPEQNPESDESQQGESQEPSEPEQSPEAQPSEVERALDALQDGEENLERYRARQRARRERRRPEKDW